jgi:uncharacterized glyoxalase superfamily protein PhnB
MEQVLALRPFVPAKDYGLSKRYYQALGFTATLENDEVTVLKMESFSFILQNAYEQTLAENLMLQLLVRDGEAWWQAHDPARFVGEFGVKAPKPPAMQPWGLKVGFIFDPSGVLWHVAEAPF